MNINKIQERKIKGDKLTMLTCYDYWSAQLLDQSDVDMLLVGDSLAMVMHGHQSTLPASVEMIDLHTKAVVKGAPSKFIVSDMPFMSVRKDLRDSLTHIETFMKSGASAVKIEGIDGHEEVISHAIGSGVPVMGHLGLTPQSVNQLGGYKVQGKTDADKRKIREDAKRLQDLGCFSIVFECVPAALASEISRELKIPVIGIGAGPDVDGQVLVLHDALGLGLSKKPRFVKEYCNGRSIVSESIATYVSDVKSGRFPSQEESY